MLDIEDKRGEHRIAKKRPCIVQKTNTRMDLAIIWIVQDSFLFIVVAQGCGSSLDMMFLAKNSRPTMGND